jgi:hypothetical protein
LRYVALIACWTTQALALLADLARWGVWGAGVLRGLPTLPLVVWAGFDSCLDDLTALVWGAAKALRVRDDLTGAWAFWEIWVDLTRCGLALGEGCSAINKE